MAPVIERVGLTVPESVMIDVLGFLRGTWVEEHVRAREILKWLGDGESAARWARLIEPGRASWTLK